MSECQLHCENGTTRSK